MTRNKYIIVLIILFIIGLYILNEIYIFWIIPFKQIGIWACKPYDRNVTYCSHSIVRNYGAINYDGTETCYNKLGFRTGSLSGWGAFDDGKCVKEGCEQGVKILCGN